MKKVNQEFVDNLFSNVTTNLFRLECLQDYSAEDGFDTVENFIKTNNLGFRVSSNPFWKNIRELNLKGIKTSRIRIVKYPVNNYTKFELAFYKKASKFSGEKIYLIDDKDFGKLQIPQEDFWIFDNKTILVGNYEKFGKLKYWGLLENKEEIKKYISYKNSLLESKNIELIA